jgi:hypothetical protein
VRAPGRPHAGPGWPGRGRCRGYLGGLGGRRSLRLRGCGLAGRRLRLLGGRLLRRALLGRRVLLLPRSSDPFRLLRLFGLRLRITKSGLEAIDVEDEATAAPKATRVRPTPARAVETPAPEATASRNRISVAAQKSARKKHRPGRAKTKAASSRESRR